jgi:hypothetical protein
MGHAHRLKSVRDDLEYGTPRSYLVNESTRGFFKRFSSRKASEIIMQNPASLELRRMQMLTEVGAEQKLDCFVAAAPRNDDDRCKL